MKTFSILLLIFNAAMLLGQEQGSILEVEHKRVNQKLISNEEIYKLMHIIKNDSYDDCLRVDAVHLLDRVNCDTCTKFLINNMELFFSCGDGISDLDQSTFTACCRP